MAASLGATSLADVHHEGLNEILRDLANAYPVHAEQEPQVLGVPVLDALLEVFMQRAMGLWADTAHQRLSREQILTEDEEMLLLGDEEEGVAEPGENPATSELPSNILLAHSNRSKLPSPVVEISSSLSASGKSQLLYYLIALAILPRSFGDSSIGGHEAAVVLIDADDRFDARALRIVVRGIASEAKGLSDSDRITAQGPPDDELETVVSSAMQHVHVFRPQSSSALLATLCALDTYFFDISRHHSASRPLQMIAIDSVTAFFWQDRLRDEVARTEDIGRSRIEIDQEREQKQGFYLSDLYSQLITELKRLQGRFGCTVVYTATVSGGRPSSNSSHFALSPYDRLPSRTPSLRPALPAPWGFFPTLRLVVHRDLVRSFPPAASAHDARKDAPMRQKVVRQGKFSAWINSWGREEWPRRVADSVDALNGGCFSFYVRETGIEIPPI
ncbi:uncharacterized protein N7443_008127 [Penicillium atrosanguineum]|uniref:DNA recombination and repair protein Rad51-like C-terminal domain-containing protein n=1 Tax=Penicillium atrosanguineum TaxID=1132637 RepID=A0A9W9PMT9_9EURO|nr:uncharacterized protein N7443_008127 [Penicillium atrosanguineum]KAJ5119200.1 hypothetical protein N7526_010837 [Penicillium atrosanguineum]KAJ5297234.1 hypothetical protein N7443_008127 [Penicillium atrosanguineum]KAJ5299996.1 hypothetical protein N7476_011553 [Penicillium atrosanguineum]